MNKTVFITNMAQIDISQIANYIAKNNRLASFSIIDDFYKTFEMLSEFPLTGVVKNGIKDKTIKIYIMRKKFTIAYRIIDNNIEILRILTRYQNILAILK